MDPKKLEFLKLSYAMSREAYGSDGIQREACPPERDFTLSRQIIFQGSLELRNDGSMVAESHL